MADSKRKKHVTRKNDEYVNLVNNFVEVVTKVFPWLPHEFVYRNMHDSLRKITFNVKSLSSIGQYNLITKTMCFGDDDVDLNINDDVLTHELFHVLARKKGFLTLLIKKYLLYNFLELGFGEGLNEGLTDYCNLLFQRSINDGIAFPGICAGRAEMALKLAVIYGIEDVVNLQCGYDLKLIKKINGDLRGGFVKLCKYSSWIIGYSFPTFDSVDNNKRGEKVSKILDFLFEKRALREPINLEIYETNISNIIHYYQTDLFVYTTAITFNDQANDLPKNILDNRYQEILSILEILKKEHDKLPREWNVNFGDSIRKVINQSQFREYYQSLYDVVNEYYPQEKNLEFIGDKVAEVVDNQINNEITVTNTMPDEIVFSINEADLIANKNDAEELVDLENKHSL